MYHVPDDPVYRKKLDLFLKAAKEDDVEGIESLLKDGFPVNATNWDEGALHIAAKNNSLKVAEFLLRQPDIDVNLPYNQAYFAPLDFAVKAGYNEMVELLKQHAAEAGMTIQTG